MPMLLHLLDLLGAAAVDKLVILEDRIAAVPTILQTQLNNQHVNLGATAVDNWVILGATTEIALIILQILLEVKPVVLPCDCFLLNSSLLQITMPALKLMGDTTLVKCQQNVLIVTQEPGSLSV